MVHVKKGKFASKWIVYMACPGLVWPTVLFLPIHSISFSFLLIKRKANTQKYYYIWLNTQKNSIIFQLPFLSPPLHSQLLWYSHPLGLLTYILGTDHYVQVHMYRQRQFFLQAGAMCLHISEEASARPGMTIYGLVKTNMLIANKQIILSNRFLCCP